MFYGSLKFCFMNERKLLCYDEPDVSTENTFIFRNKILKIRPTFHSIMLCIKRLLVSI